MAVSKLWQITVEERRTVMFLCVKNADVYSPAHLGKKDILICNDRIIAMEPELKALPEGCRIVDAAGRRVIP